MNGKGLLNDNVTIMTGVPFPGTKADFVKNLFLGKYDGTSGSNLEAFQVCNIEKKPHLCLEKLESEFVHLRLRSVLL